MHQPNRNIYRPTILILVLSNKFPPIGIPSTPQASVLSVSVNGQVRIQITTAYAGVFAKDKSLHFNVSVYNGLVH